MTNLDLGINFIAADEGGLRFIIMTTEGEIRRRADDIEDGVHWVETYGVANTVYASSSMDFATEEFFETDDGAKQMWQTIMNTAAEAKMMEIV